MEQNSTILDDYIPIAEFAAELGVHVGTLKRWKAEKKGPPPFRIGKRVFYRRSEIAAWLASLGQATPAKRAHR